MRLATLKRRLRALPHNDHGQVLPLVAVSMVVMLGLAALSCDVGRTMYSSRELQAITDSAALAAARAIPTATAYSQVNGGSSAAGPGITQYTGTQGAAAQISAVTGGENARSTIPNVTITTTLKCLTTIEAQGIPCIGTVPYNAAQVTQTSTIPMYFAGVLGHPTQVLTSTSTAAIRGGAPRPTNIAIVLDETLSMNEYDSNCGNTQNQCALNGVQVLLQNLTPCGTYQTTCSNGSGGIANAFDSVALFTFPNVTIGTASIDVNCTTNVPSSYTYNSTVGGYIVMPPSSAWSGISTSIAYSLPTAGANQYTPNGASNATYQLTGFLADYKVNDSANQLNSSSALVKAAGAVAGCNGMQPTNYDGVYGTYYAGAIYAAQAALTAQKAANPSTDNVMIILSDGDATAGTIAGIPGLLNGTYSVFASGATGNGSYPSYVGMCSQAVTAAKAASSAGTLVYTVAYGSEPTGCVSDTFGGAYPDISPCDTMADMATAPQMFYSDWQQSGSGSTCYASQPVTSLHDIFLSIANDLSQARLIPNNTA